MILIKDESTKDILKRYESEVVIDNEKEFTVPEAVKLSKDVKETLLKVPYITRDELKLLYDIFKDIQQVRVATTERIRSIETAAKNNAKQAGEEYCEPTLAISKYVLKNISNIEAGMTMAFKLCLKDDPVGGWLMDICGVGPAIAAGLLAYFDVDSKDYASQFISYAGLNNINRPWLGREKSKVIVEEVIGDSDTITDDHIYEIARRTQWNSNYLFTYGRSERDKDTGITSGDFTKESLIKACSKIPYNAKLRSLLHVAACSINYKKGPKFKKTHPNGGKKYGELLDERIDYETRKNEAGEYRDQALEKAEALKKSKKCKSDLIKIYESGKLPPSHIRMRAMRWMEKVFVCHLFEEMYRVKYDKLPPRYYALEHLEGHNVDIKPEVPFTKVSSELEF